MLVGNGDHVCGELVTTTNGTKTRRADFLRVFILWHPDFAAPHDISGLGLAEKLYRRLSRDPRRPLAPVLGIPVYFFTSESADSLPPVLDLDASHHCVVALLIDPHLALSDAWCAYARDLCSAALSRPGRHLVLPICLVDRTQAPDLGPTQAVNLALCPIDQRSLMLELRLMAEICRLLQGMPRGTSGDLQLSSEPVKLFISHAKMDGEDDARQLQQSIQQSHLDTFFDETHIASGYDFSQEILGNIQRSALVVIQSDAYASRPWCRKEVLAAKRYQRPIVVAHRMSQGEERSFPYLGNVPTVSWTGENHAEIVAVTLREYLRKLYLEASFEILQRSGEILASARCLIRPPELIDGLTFRDAPGAVRTDCSADQQLVVYPDPPLGTEETEILNEFFPRVVFATPSTMVRRQDMQRLNVAISISRSLDLLRKGFGDIHYSSAMVEIARHVLVRGGAIAYGGDLRPISQGGHAEQLFQLVRAYQHAGLGQVPRIKNFLAWQDHVSLPPAEELERKRVAELVRTPMPSALAAAMGLDALRPLDHSFAKRHYVLSRCRSEMRREMNRVVDARISMGGKVTGYAGKYPGILEEALLAIEDGKPLYLLGAFGGCTKLVIDALMGRPVTALTGEYQLRSNGPAYAALVRDYDQCPSLSDPEPPVDYTTAVDMLRRSGVAGLNNGLSEEDNEELFTSVDLDRTVQLVMKGLTCKFEVC